MQTRTTTATSPDAGGYAFETWMRQRATHAEELRALWAMTPAERRASMYRRELTQRQLYAWAGARPDEVPLLEGEFWFIAERTPEVAEAPAAADCRGPRR